MQPSNTIEACSTVEQPGWLNLRQALWPDCPCDEHLTEMAGFIADPGRYAQFVAYASASLPIGFVEASLRIDYVNGTDTSPVVFLEGIYVAPGFRRQGLAAQLVAAVATWARSRGCSEFASDAPLDNELSHAVHLALGFTETERVVYFRKPLG
ncbi:aminoglycoside 6'-N-acetyltransferase [Chitinimonas sp. BJB300]|uniref:aminoglycoside 6'-N-acetyltransferase n=1 Tax=Chitinimonas sp. BJB300 TaxID=1559339 RepID=UPI000C0FF3F9|nr:aminoglycoside 6'-N-acetyltransferase [Chitinimonas sp. BJB300]PHV10297.1 aminoglycoside 6'-acetyltransferase [Chitinimonas sp. BJB300]TSJ91547.1 GNAT family N-acetyltransferase [Chitinimonas sp. BJB300]